MTLAERILAIPYPYNMNPLYEYKVVWQLAIEDAANLAEQEAAEDETPLTEGWIRMNTEQSGTRLWVNHVLHLEQHDKVWLVMAHLRCVVILFTRGDFIRLLRALGIELKGPTP